MTAITAADIIRSAIAESSAEDRIVTLYPDTAEDADALLSALGVECDDDCSPYDHIDGSHDVWGTDDHGSEWRVHVMFVAGA